MSLITTISATKRPALSECLRLMAEHQRGYERVMRSEDGKITVYHNQRLGRWEVKENGVPMLVSVVEETVLNYLVGKRPQWRVMEG